MCSIFGAYLPHGGESARDGRVQDALRVLRSNAGDRGRDGGRMLCYGEGGEEFGYEHLSTFVHSLTPVCILGNWRATPTTEVADAPLQPYHGIVHNGTIANDKELGGRDGDVDSMVLPRVLVTDGAFANFVASLAKIKGSYAIAAVTPDADDIYLAVNYKPLYIIKKYGVIFFSSMKRHLAFLETPYKAARALAPYSAMRLSDGETETLYDQVALQRVAKRALVIASAGLDSTVVATKLIADGYDVTLLHFTYGARAQSPEREAISKIAASLGCPLIVKDLTSIYEGSSSNLIGTSGSIAEGVAGSEYAHEWVPARNLVMIAVATAVAEELGCGYIALGNNLEESGAYPDNEEEFIFRMNRALTLAVQNGNFVQLLQPVGNLMKHEIVSMGLRLGAPLELTWSCYKARTGTDSYIHCGNCGPCFMRKEAFKRVGAVDPVFA